MSKLFVSPSLVNPVEIARDTIEVGLNEAGVAVVQFSLCRGKGLGSQEVPVAELGLFIEALSGYATDGINRVSRGALSSIEQLHATISTVEIGDDETEYIQFRASGTQGKGSKPTRCLPRELRNVVSFLSEVLPMVQTEAAKLTPKPKKS